MWAPPSPTALAPTRCTYTVIATGTSTETTGTVVFGSGATLFTIDNTTGAQNSTITLGGTAPSFAAGTSVVYTGAHGTANNKLMASNAPSLVPATSGILAMGLILSGGVYNFASYNSDGFTTNTGFGFQAFADYYNNGG